MSIDEFNNLPIDKQVEYINKELEGSSLNKICKSLGISESTVRDRFKRNNYKRVDKKFVVNTTETTTNTNKKVLPLESKIKPVKKVDNLDSIKLLEEKIKALESQIEATNKSIDNLNTSKTTINTTTDTTINTYKGNEVVRSFRVNEEVQQRFKVYCKANSDHKVSDILSTALEEFLNNREY